MGMSVYVEVVLVNAVKDFPFLKAALEKNAEKDMVFGMECYVWEDLDGDSIYEWDFDVGISEEDIMKEIERQRVQMEKKYYWDEEKDRLKVQYIKFITSEGECTGWSHSVDF